MKKLMFAITPGLMALLLTGAVMQKQRENDKGEKGAPENQSVTRVSVKNGETLITLNQQDQMRLAITVAPVQGATSREEVSTAATILPVQDLIALRDGYIASRTRLEKARIDARVSQKEYDRLRALYQDNQNIAEKTVQAQQGLLESNQAEVQAAEQQLRLQEHSAKQQWGGVVSNWIIHDSPEVERVLDQHDFLLQITPPSGTLSKAPQTASLELPAGSRAQAHLIAPYPRVDPRIQGASFIYLVNAHPGLAPGLNLIAHLPGARLQKGAIIPYSAVVWWQGEQWVYLQTAPDRFTRRQLPTSSRVPNGFFIASGFSPGNRVVVSGAQMLLSEESRSATPAGQKADTD
jgi:hypothetical protein